MLGWFQRLRRCAQIIDTVMLWMIQPKSQSNPMEETHLRHRFDCCSDIDRMTGWGCLKNGAHFLDGFRGKANVNQSVGWVTNFRKFTNGHGAASDI